MKLQSPEYPLPHDAELRRAQPPTVCYPIDTLPKPDLGRYRHLREASHKTGEMLVPPRDGRCTEIAAGSFFRIVSIDGPQVGDLNLWRAQDISERFYSSKTRALHGTHLSTGDRLWSGFPYLRPMATITADSLDWYGFDADGGSVHDVIGSRCDPYTGKLLSGQDYHYCCHSNLTRALASHLNIEVKQAEMHVHDVLNVFMCTGFLNSTGQYFMKASPVRPGDYLEFYAEIDLILGLSACPGGDCSATHSSDVAQCYPLLIETYAPKAITATPPAPSSYDRSHGRIDKA